MSQKGFTQVLIIAIISALVIFLIAEAIYFKILWDINAPKKNTGPDPVTIFEGKPSFSPGPNVDNPVIVFPATGSATN